MMTSARPLLHLALSLSDDTTGTATLEAMASGRGGAAETPRWAAIEDELQTLLAWAHHHGPGSPGALDDGHGWDHTLQHHDEADGWCTVTLTLCVAPGFAEDFVEGFVERFGAPGDASG